MHGGPVARPGLDDRTRRLLALTGTAALVREEFRMHVRMGLRGGLEATDLEEILLQLAMLRGCWRRIQGFRSWAKR